MSTKTPEIEVLPNQYDGWDVKHAGTSDAISNHPEKAEAIEAAHKIAEHEEGDVEVVVKEEAEESVSDEGRGVKFYFVALFALLTVIVLIIVISSIASNDTGTDANLGEGGTLLSPLLLR
jgi:hypothetical protein